MEIQEIVELVILGLVRGAVIYLQGSYKVMSENRPQFTR